MRVTVITCTGLRPELFALCRKWVERQTVKPSRWIVATDVAVEPDIPSWADHVQLDSAVDLVSTFDPSNRSLAIALDLVDSSHSTVIMEDDDWYPSDYIESRVSAVERGADIAGNRTERRYHVPGRLWHVAAKAMPNAGCCILAPGMAGHFSNWLRDPDSRRSFWQPFRRDYDLATHRVSIKGAGYGLPGRPGGTHKLGEHHKKWTPDDDDFPMLRNWCGADANEYIRLLSP